MAVRILVINLGSTSSKIAVYDDSEPVFNDTINHAKEKIDSFAEIEDQHEWRREIILETLKSHNIPVGSINVIACRGGLLRPDTNGVLSAGAYEINEDMLYELKYHAINPHPTNQAAAIAESFAKEWGIKAYIYDAPTVDEMIPITRITGRPEFQRRGMGHPLNMRSAALKYAESVGKPYNKLTLIVTHMGGGISNTLHKNGVMIDVVHDEEGSFTPERAGGLPGFQLIDYMTEKLRTQREMKNFVQRDGGLKALLGTTDAREVERRIKEGDEYAELVYHAMALNMGKSIGKLAVTASGRVDQIILTGGLSQSKMLTDWIIGYVSFIAPVTVIPGENEMPALAEGILRVYNGAEKAKIYIRNKEE